MPSLRFTLNLTLLLLLLLTRVTLALDGQSDPIPESEAEAIFNDPKCLRPSRGSIDWSNFRALDLPQMSERLLHSTEFNDWDSSARECLFGMITLWYWSAWKSSHEMRLEDAMRYFNWLDTYYSSVHPGLFEKGDWRVTDRLIGDLRRSLIPKRDQSPGIRIYLYTPDDCPLLAQLTEGASFCSKGQWGSEVHIHDYFVGSEYRTMDPEEADWFFVPGYGICMFEAGFLSMSAVNQIYTQLPGCLPHFQPRGKRHIFTFGSGMSASLFRSWRDYISDATFLTPETGLFNDFAAWQTEPDFTPGKDIVITGHLHRSEVLGLLAESKTDWDSRPLLGVFFGRVDISRSNSKVGSPRHDLINMLMDPAQWPEGLPADVLVGQNLTTMEMYRAMGQAKYCLVPRGKSEWSLRFFESLFAGCVPVMLADGWTPLPFTSAVREGGFTVAQEAIYNDGQSDAPMFPFNESDFVLRLPSKLTQSRELIDKLREYPREEAKRILLNIPSVRCWYLYGAQSAATHMQERHLFLGKDVCGHDSDREANALNGIVQQLKVMTSKKDDVFSRV